MGGTDANRSGIEERQKPPLPPKPPFLTVSNRNIDSSRHIEGITASEGSKECQMHDVEINQLSDSAEPIISLAGTAIHNMEKTSHTEPSSVNASQVSTLSSDKTGTRRPVSRARPRRTSRHSLENGESGDEACCIRFAGMLRNKAVDVASKAKILPPAKPPKPDHLAKPKARRHKGSQQNGLSCHHSVGDDFSIDGSCHGVRFVDDDETESSTDYKDFDGNSVFLLELACHCDAQNISIGTGIVTEAIESGYYTSDVVKTDEEANLSDNSKMAAQKESEQASPLVDKTELMDDTEALPSVEKELVGSTQEIDSQPASSEAVLDGKKSIVLNSSERFTSNKESAEKQEEPMPKPRRVKSPPRPPPPQIKKQVEPVITAGEIKPCEVSKEDLISDKEIAPIQSDKEIPSKESGREETDGTTAVGETKEEGITPSLAVVDSVKSEQDIPVTETPQTKKRVTSPPRPPPPKIKEAISPSERQTSSETKDLKQNDDSAVKKQPPFVPNKPDRKEILAGKSSLEPLDLSTVSDAEQPSKPSLSPKTFPRSSKQGGRSGKSSVTTTQLKKMEFPSRLKPSDQATSKPVMTTVVRNTYLNELQPLQSTSEKKSLPPRPPPPLLTKTEGSIIVSGTSQQNESAATETSAKDSETTDSALPENTDGFTETKQENLNAAEDIPLEQSVICVQNEQQEVPAPSVDLSLQDAKGDDKLESEKQQFVRDEIQSSTWPIAAERKKRKQMKSPPRPPPPVRGTIVASAESSSLQKETLPQKAYEISSLDSRGRKRIKSPPRPPPPNKSSLKTEEKSVPHSDAGDENGTKRIKSPPRPPPPLLVKSSVDQIESKAVKLPASDTSNETFKSYVTLPHSEKAASSTKENINLVPLATEENTTEDTDISLPVEHKKRVVSPPRPPPPVYERLSMRQTEKPVISTTPRTRKPKEMSDEQRQFMSLQRPSGIPAHVAANLQSPSGGSVLHEYEEIHPPDKERPDSPKMRPKPPPRVKRNRSRTVEVVMVTEKPEERKRRSHSLTEADILKKLEDRALLSTPQHSGMKTIYTTVQKERGKAKLKEVDTDEEGRRTPGFDKMKLRPLPPPPPPPRCRSRSSMSQSPASPGLNTSLSEEVKLDVKQDSCDRTGQQPEYKLVLEYDENANISVPSLETEKGKQEISHSEKSVGKCDEMQIQHHDQLDQSKSFHKKSPSPPSARSKSPSPSKHRSCSSWYDESDVSGDLGDVDTSSSIKGSAEGLNKDDLESTSSKQKQNKSKSDHSRTSTFYYDLEDDAFHDCATEFPLSEMERPVSSCSLAEKSVQTSPERELCVSGQEKHDHSDDTDDLLDRARSVQNELCLMLERRKRKKSQSRCGEDDTKSSCSYTPSPKSTMSRNRVQIACDPPPDDPLPSTEIPLAASPVSGRTQLSSAHSSNSELAWQVMSSGESDDDDDTSSVLQKKKNKAFQIAKEIMTSEEIFISSLKLLNEDFRGAVDKANKDRGGTVISEEALNSFLKYFPQLQHLNENLVSELKERIKHWEENEKIADIIVKIGPFLKLYSSYIRDFDAMEAALMDARKKYPLFDQVTKEFESGPQCKKLRLNHYMLKPIQRIPLYRLLLQQYLHNLTPDSADYGDTLTALQIVCEVADHANKTLKQGDNFQKLISIQNSLLSQYEVVRPGRVFLKEGELMKLSRKEMQPRWFILFSDSLLYLTSTQQGLFKVINELPLAGMKVHIPQHQDYQNEFSIISVTRSFTLAARSLEERQEWIDALNKAIEEYATKRSTFATVMMQQKGKDIESDSSFVLGKQAPVWIPDGRVTMCQLCTSDFTVTFRRHHCRACGKVVCSLCSANRAPLQYRNFSVARVCDECLEKLQKEFEAAELLENVEESGSCSEVAENDSDSPHAMASIKAHFKGNARNVGKKNKRQLPKVLKEVCANDQGSTISGYLYRRHRKYWKRFWFVLKDKVLYTYKASEDIAALESVPLLGYQVEKFRKPFEGVEAELLFQLTHPGQDPIIFRADTTVSLGRWIQAVQHATILE